MTNRAHLRLALPCRLRDALVCGASAIVIGALAAGSALAGAATGFGAGAVPGRVAPPLISASKPRPKPLCFGDVDMIRVSTPNAPDNQSPQFGIADSGRAP